MGSFFYTIYREEKFGDSRPTGSNFHLLYTHVQYIPATQLACLCQDFLLQIDGWSNNILFLVLVFEKLELSSLATATLLLRAIPISRSKKNKGFSLSKNVLV